MKICAKSTLVAGTIFACGTLPFIDCESTSAGIEAAPAKLRPPASSTSVARTTVRKAHRIVRGTLAARKTKAHLSIVGSKSRRVKQLAFNRKTSLVTNLQVPHWKKPNRAASEERPPKKQLQMSGSASFYSEDAETTSGQGFDKHELAAAHPTLPFATRLRVTNVRDGRFVIVRVNEFIRGRVVDVTSTAAEALAMIREGVIDAKLDIVR